jgi:hypothetical protein
MELNQTKKEDVSNPYMDKLIKKAIGQLPKETDKNHGSVGSHPKKHCLYNPHDYRLYFKYDKSTMVIPPTMVKTMVNSTETMVRDFQGFQIRVKKTQLELTNLNKQWYRINITEESAIETQFEAIRQSKDQEGIVALKEWIKICGGKTDFDILRRRSEHKIMNEDAIDRLPKNMTFRNDAVKKVYMEQNVEFSSPILASNYLRNRAIESISPEIIGSLQAIAEAQRSIVDKALNPLTEQIILHLKVQRETLKTQKEMAKTMKAIRSEMKTNKRSERVRDIKTTYGW